VPQAPPEEPVEHPHLTDAEAEYETDEPEEASDSEWEQDSGGNKGIKNAGAGSSKSRTSSLVPREAEIVRREEFGAGGGPIFCSAGDCLYWHTRIARVTSHRNTHYPDRGGFLCPNKECPRSKQDNGFLRPGAVTGHCMKAPACHDAFRAKLGKMDTWGTPATEGELREYDPAYHKAHRHTCGVRTIKSKRG
jgi:hypothetical protein